MRKLAWFALPFSGATILAQLLLPRSIWPAAGVLCALLALAAVVSRRDLRLRMAMVAVALAFLWSWG